MKSSPTLLITAAGTGTAWGYIRAVRKHYPALRLITADSNPKHLVAGSCLADMHAVFPLFEPSTYGSVIREAIDRLGITHYLPVIDPEIVFATAQDDLPCTVLAPDAKFCRMASEKSMYPRRFTSDSLCFPRTYTPDEAAKFLPCWAKGDGGYGGRASRLITDEAGLSTVPASWLLQEHIAGREFTVDCFPLDDFNVITSVRERLEVKSGVCTRARIFQHEGLERMSYHIARTMTHRSPFCFQAMERSDGTLAVTDINPRLGAGTALSAANGLDFFAAHVAQALGDDPLPHMRRRYDSCFVTRQYVEFLAESP